MPDGLSRRNRTVIKFLLLAEVIIQKFRQRPRTTIADSITIKNPLIFGNIVSTELLMIFVEIPP